MGKANKEVVPFDPQESDAVTEALDILRSDAKVPRDFINKISNVVEMEIRDDGNKVTFTGPKTAQIQHAVMAKSLLNYDIVALKGVDRYYARRMNPETHTPLDSVYVPMDKDDLLNIISTFYEETTGTIDGTAIDKIWNSLDKKIRKDNTIDKVDNTIIQLIPGHDKYWNTETGDVTETIPDGYRCFRRLFDTTKETKHIVKLDPDELRQEEYLLMPWITVTYNYLNKHNGDLKEEKDFEFIQTVACGDHERYMDILRMFATFFMKKKPLGTYILEGNGRNGKSGIIGLIHTLMGSRNTSKLQLAELGNWHKNHCLVNTLVNAPDEEKPGTLEDTDLFRVIADHGDIELDVMRGQQPIEVTCDFQCVSASNHLPNWEGVDAEACIRRARIIPFMADLSGNDNSSVSFEKITYTPERMVRLLGVVLGIAKYYMSHDFPESKSTEMMKSILQENMVSYRLYYKSFIGFFGKYHKLRDVFDDYSLWCKDHECKINKYDEFKEAFNESRGKKTSHRDSNVDLNVVYRVGHLSTCFYKDWVCPEAVNYGTVEQMHEAGVSVVTLLEELRDRALSEGVGGK